MNRARRLTAAIAAVTAAATAASCGIGDFGNTIEKKDMSGTTGEQSSEIMTEADSSGQAAVPVITPAQIAELFSGLEGFSLPCTEEFFEWCVETTDDPQLLDSLYSEASEGLFSDEKWYELTGMTVKATDSLYEPSDDESVYVLASNGEDGVQLTFGGDISLADNWQVMEYYRTTGGIHECISPFLIDSMKNADIAMLNNEFCLSDNGSPMEGKAWTFEGKPENVSIYHELGIDIVDLANNHCFDFGEQAFLDTLDTLTAADIQYMGAGRNIEEASRPVYYIVEGKKIAYVAATRAEKYILTPEAGSDSPGVLRCYDPSAFIDVIREAKQNADIVIANVHWGTEDSHQLEDVQPETAYQYIDAGADLIVGSHAHCLQGIEYYKGIPIVYNLGNFWFSRYDIDTGLLGVTINKDNSMELTFYPATQRDCKTTYVGGEEEGSRILQCMRDYSINVQIDENGVITEKK